MLVALYLHFPYLRFPVGYVRFQRPRRKFLLTNITRQAPSPVSMLLLAASLRQANMQSAEISATARSHFV